MSFYGEVTKGEELVLVKGDTLVIGTAVEDGKYFCGSSALLPVYPTAGPYSDLTSVVFNVNHWAVYKKDTPGLVDVLLRHIKKGGDA